MSKKKEKKSTHLDNGCKKIQIEDKRIKCKKRHKMEPSELQCDRASSQEIAGREKDSDNWTNKDTQPRLDGVCE